jgi:hypothetical protein
MTNLLLRVEKTENGAYLWALLTIPLYQAMKFNHHNFIFKLGIRFCLHLNLQLREAVLQLRLPQSVLLAAPQPRIGTD